MKRLFLLFLATVMLLTACSTAVETASTDGTSGTSSSVSADTLGPGEESEEVFDPPSRHTLVSVGKPYTCSVDPSGGGYDDFFDQQLTDGLKAPDVGTHYLDSRMVGFADDCIFPIDLGEDGKRISAVVANAPKRRAGIKGLPFRSVTYGFYAFTE